jgi:4-hydroxybenzoyl-CoA thioesterase
MTFIRRMPVRFDHVDFARIVYFPRFFEYCHEVFEDFFAAEVGLPYARMLNERGVGFPSVHAEADFKSPLRFGDTVRVELETVKVGETSLTCRYRLFEDAQNRLAATITLVTVTMRLDSARPESIPEDVRTAFERHSSP